MSALAELGDELRREGGLLAGALHLAGASETYAPGGRHALVLEAIREGYLLHYEQGRVLRPDDDPDLALLAGDRLFALGLARVAESGDLDAVTALADLISASAVARASGDRDAAEQAWTAALRSHVLSG